MVDETYVLVQIGPVQSWIKQARRTQDLFTGSQLLSMLAYYGIAEAMEQGARVVIPAVGKAIDRDASYPNRFVLACPTGDAETIMQAVHEAIHVGWRDSLAGAVQDYLREKLRGATPRQNPGIDFNEDIWRRQIDNFLEVYIVFTPNTGDYQEDNARLNYLMNARKQIRHMHTAGEPGFKCSLTGEHEALHDMASGEASLRDVREFWDEVRRRHPNKAEFNEGERLCAISTVKRLNHEIDPAYKEARFPSTSTIACARFRVAVIQQWGDERVRGAVDAYIQSLESLMVAVGVKRETLYFTRENKPNRERFPYIENLVREMGLSWDADNLLLHRFMSFDGDWLFEDTLIPRTVREYTGVDDAAMKKPSVKSALRAAREALLVLVKTVKTRPTSYYAIIHMDGDDMGKRAEYFSDADSHTALSADLLRFATETIGPQVEDIIPGRLVYSGGDDVLALVPASDALKAADAIAARFEETIGSSMSAGIAIVHHTHNLSDALQAARDAEKKAKDVPGKSAFCVAFLRRSGESRSATMKWYETQPVVPVIAELVTVMREGQISRQLAVEMPPFVYATVPVIGEGENGRLRILTENVPDGLRYDAFKRIFDRRIKPGDPAKDQLQNLREKLYEIAEYAPDGQSWHAVTTLIELARFLSQMEVTGVAVD